MVGLVSTLSVRANAGNAVTALLVISPANGNLDVVIPVSASAENSAHLCVASAIKNNLQNSFCTATKRMMKPGIFSCNDKLTVC